MTEVELLYADECLLAVHKKPGIPCQSRSHKPPYPLDKTLGLYVNEPVNLWTRIDQPVSGIVLFRRENSTLPHSLTITQKTYLGIVEGHPAIHGEETLISYILRDGRKMKAIEDKKQGKKAMMSFEVLKTFNHYTLIKIMPTTGRFHQIRHQLAQYGHPIKGDVKYGARRKNSDRSIHLHALEYVVRQDNKAECRIQDYSFPNDPLWSLTRKFIVN